jgi:hypothetical protein
VRKPFQPQELISRVKNLIGHGAPALQQPSERPMAVPSLSSLFSAPAAPRVVPPPAPVHAAPPAPESRPADHVWPRALAEAFVQQGNAAAQQAPPAAPNAAPRAAGTATDVQKLRVEISRLEILVKKLQTELQIERQYNQALELHVRTLTQVD